MTKYYDVIVNNRLDECKQLYRILMMIGCQNLTRDSNYLKQAVIHKDLYCVCYAYRIYIDANGIYHYHSYRNSDEVYNGISLTDFIKMVKPERTVTL